MSTRLQAVLFGFALAAVVFAALTAIFAETGHAGFSALAGMVGSTLLAVVINVLTNGINSRN